MGIWKSMEMLNSESFRARLYFKRNVPAIYRLDIVKIAKQWKFVLGILQQSPGILEFFVGGVFSRTQIFLSLRPDPIASENIKLSGSLPGAQRRHFTTSTHSRPHGLKGSSLYRSPTSQFPFLGFS